MFSSSQHACEFWFPLRQLLGHKFMWTRFETRRALLIRFRASCCKCWVEGARVVVARRLTPQCRTQHSDPMLHNILRPALLELGYHVRSNALFADRTPLPNPSLERTLRGCCKMADGQALTQTLGCWRGAKRWNHDSDISPCVDPGNRVQQLCTRATPHIAPQARL